MKGTQPNTAHGFTQASHLKHIVTDVFKLTYFLLTSGPILTSTCLCPRFSFSSLLFVLYRHVL